MKFVKNFWGLIPIIIFLLLKIVLLIIEKSLNLVLRDTPAGILSWFLVLSVLVLLIYVILKIFSLNFIKKFKFAPIIKNMTIFLYCLGALAVIGITMFISAFTYCSEEVVVENGVKMVARDTSYLDFSMEYDQYENALFRGEQLLKEIRNTTYWIYDSHGELMETGTYK